MQSEVNDTIEMVQQKKTYESYKIFIEIRYVMNSALPCSLDLAERPQIYQAVARGFKYCTEQYCIDLRKLPSLPGFLLC